MIICDLQLHVRYLDRCRFNCKLTVSKLLKVIKFVIPRQACGSWKGEWRRNQKCRAEGWRRRRWWWWWWSHECKAYRRRLPTGLPSTAAGRGRLRSPSATEAADKTMHKTVIQGRIKSSAGLSAVPKMRAPFPGWHTFLLLLPWLLLNYAYAC